MAESVRALRAALERRFRTSITEVTLASRRLRVLHPADAEALIDEADFERDERLPYWADVWPSAQVLAARLLRERGAGRRLLELGCGAGLVASAAAVAGFEVTATDYYEDALRFARVNAGANAHVRIATRHADWRDWPRALRGFDVVVASDVLYERASAVLVGDVLSHALAPGGVAIIADPGRFAVPAFLATCAAHGLAAERAGQVPFERGPQRQRIDLYEVRRSATTSARS